MIPNAEPLIGPAETGQPRGLASVIHGNCAAFAFWISNGHLLQQPNFGAISEPHNLCRDSSNRTTTPPRHRRHPCRAQHTHATMNAPSLLTRRTASVCFSCRRSLLRQCQSQRLFSTTPASLVAAFQAYTLPSQPPPAPRNASVPDSSIATPVPSPSLPRIHETRPPKHSAPLSIPEAEAQQSKPAFASTPSPPAAQPTPSQPPQQTAQTQTTPPTPSTSPAAAAPKPAARPRSKLRARKAAINLTPGAVEHLRALLDQPDPKLIKVGVRNRGCSGLAYHLEYVDKAGAFDEAVEQDGVKVLIDSKALFSIIGSEMDWVEDKLSQRFVFRNPNISECLSFFGLGLCENVVLTVWCRGAVWLWRVVHGMMEQGMDGRKNE